MRIGALAAQRVIITGQLGAGCDGLGCLRPIANEFLHRVLCFSQGTPHFVSKYA
jgi:hypothetical protein